MANQAPERVVNGIKTRVLHGKDYVEVNTRVQILHSLIKAGEIKEFEMVESEPREIAGQLYWRVSARIDGKLYIGNAEVKLDAPKNTPDGTNPISCAETSAFGRMLGLAGLGTLESIASYDEVARGQPFTKIVEQSNGQVVESRPVQNQIEGPIDQTIKATNQGLYNAALQAKKRAQTLGLDDTKWLAMLQYLGIEQFANGADIAKVNGKLTEMEKKQPKAS